MKFLSFLINLILIIAITATSLLVIIDLTVSAGYITSLAQRTNSYTTLSQLMPAVIAKQGNTPEEQQQIETTMTAVLTPDFLQTQITDITGQFERALKGNATQVTIPLDQVAVRARSQGLDIPSDQFKAYTLGSDQLAKPAMIVHDVELAKLIGIIATAVLFALALLMSIRRRKYGALASSLIIAGVCEGVFVAATVVLPNQLLQKTQLNGDFANFTPLVHTLVAQLAHDLMFKFLAIAVALIVTGIILHVLNHKLPRPGDEASKEMEPHKNFLDDIDEPAPKRF